MCVGGGGGGEGGGGRVGAMMLGYASSAEASLD